MAVVNNPVAITGNNELEFWTNFISYMTSLDSRITCNTTAAEQCDIRSTYTPIYIFDFDGKFQIKFSRQAQWNNWCQNYAVSFIINGTTYTPSSPYLLFCTPNDGTYRPDTVVSMKYYVGSVISDNSIFIWLGSFSSTGATDGSQMAGGYLENYAGYSSNYDIMSGSFYASSGGGGVLTTFYSPLTYAVNPGSIDYISKGIFVSGTTKVFETTSIYSCSTVPKFSNISLPNGKNFYAIGANALIEVDT